MFTIETSQGDFAFAYVDPFDVVAGRDHDDDDNLASHLRSAVLNALDSELEERGSAGDTTWSDMTNAVADEIVRAVMLELAKG
jgi:hypothetical protein